MNVKSKKLLILGGSRISCEIVKNARRLGIYTGVTDWYEYEESPAKQIANKWHMVSTADTEAVVDLIKEENYDGVITGFTDSVLPYYAQICEKAGLPCYGTEEQFDIFINKRKYKKICEDYGVPVVNEYKISDKLTDKEIENVKFPVLVKPSDSSGARGITICHTKEDLVEAYKKALDFSQAKEVLVERYIEGKEVTVFWTFIDGQIYLSGIGNRHMRHHEEGSIALPVAYTFPSIYTNEYVKNIQPKVEKMLKSLNVNNGMMFMQCLIENNECIVYDIGYRLTGSLEYKLLEEVCGYNPLDMLINYALTGKMVGEKINITPYWPKYGCNVSYLIKPGKIQKVSGLDKLKELPGFLEVVQAHLQGETLQLSAKGTLKQIGMRAFGVADDKDELRSLLDSMYNNVKIYSEDGNSLLLEGLDTLDIEWMLV